MKPPRVYACRLSQQPNTIRASEQSDDQMHPQPIARCGRECTYTTNTVSLRYLAEIIFIFLHADMSNNRYFSDCALKIFALRRNFLLLTELTLIGTNDPG